MAPTRAFLATFLGGLAIFAATAAKAFEPIPVARACSAEINQGANAALAQFALERHQENQSRLDNSQSSYEREAKARTYNFEGEYAVITKRQELTAYSVKRWKCVPSFRHVFYLRHY